ncbi:Cerato-platanin [Lactarius psammicola]|nr:Cerato-platanin [Lactarius psammicola]
MKFTLTITPLVALFSVTSAVNVFYDTRFDNPKGSLATVACSDGPNGLLTKGFTTFRSLPSFPNIGAAQAVGGWNSSVCGSCWHISFGGKSINVTAIDHTGDGFNLSLEVMNNLTNGHAEEFGVINSQAAQINKKFCGL